MKQPTPAGADETRRRRLRELATMCGEHTQQTYAGILRSGDCEIPAFALLYERAGSSELLLSTASDVLTVIAQEELERDPSYSPTALVCLESGERRAARTPVFFMDPEITLPLLVGDVIDIDLAGREDDEQRNPGREAELERARDLIRSGAPLPADLYDAVADVIELDLADREDDERRDPTNERLLGEVHDQLLGRTPEPASLRVARERYPTDETKGERRCPNEVTDAGVPA